MEVNSLVIISTFARQNNVMNPRQQLPLCASPAITLDCELSMCSSVVWV
jgi:hypothetical protein